MMVALLPVTCRSHAYQLLAAQIPSLESSDALLTGAVAIAMHQMDGVNPADVDEKIQNLADRVRSRVHGRQPQAILAHLHELLFEELAFTGNEQDYYDPSNSYLPAILETHRGLPITLSLIYKLVAERLGLHAFGVALPGHFLAGIETAGRVMIIDPFYSGRELSQDEAHERLQQIYGPEIEWSNDLIRPTSHRQWLTRILQNLLNTFAANAHYFDVASMIEMEMLLWPGENHLQRDLALVLARCGMSEPAFSWLDRYLKNNPDDPQRTDLMQLRDVLAA